MKVRTILRVSIVLLFVGALVATSVAIGKRLRLKRRR